MPLAGLTAWESLFECLGLQEEDEGKCLLVIGGAGGVGSFAIQLAKAKTRLKVIATASSYESRDWCFKMGADGVIDHSKPDLKKQLIDSYQMNGVKFVLNCFDASIMHEIAEVVEPFGKVCVISAGKAIKAVDLSFLFFKRVTIAFEVVFGRSRFGIEPERQRKSLESIGELFESGKLKSSKSKEFNFDQVNHALEIIRCGHNQGKIILYNSALL